MTPCRFGRYVSMGPFNLIPSSAKTEHSALQFVYSLLEIQILSRQQFSKSPRNLLPHNVHFSITNAFSPTIYICVTPYVRSHIMHIHSYHRRSAMLRFFSHTINILNTMYSVSQYMHSTHSICIHTNCMISPTPYKFCSHNIYNH